MKRYIIAPSVLLALWIFVTIVKTSGHILWIQGNTNISIQALLWILLLITIFGEIIYMFVVNKNRIHIVYMIFFGIIIGGSVWVLNGSTTTRYFYEQNEHEIIVVNKNKILFGSIEFYYKENFLLYKEFASCSQAIGVVCEYHIEEENLIIEMFSEGEETEIIILIPSE